MKYITLILITLSLSLNCFAQNTLTRKQRDKIVARILSDAQQGINTKKAHNMIFYGARTPEDELYALYHIVYPTEQDIKDWDNAEKEYRERLKQDSINRPKILAEEARIANLQLMAEHIDTTNLHKTYPKIIGSLIIEKIDMTNDISDKIKIIKRKESNIIELNKTILNQKNQLSTKDSINQANQTLLLIKDNDISRRDKKIDEQQFDISKKDRQLKMLGKITILSLLSVAALLIIR